MTLPPSFPVVQIVGVDPCSPRMGFGEFLLNPANGQPALQSLLIVQPGCR